MERTSRTLWLGRSAVACVGRSSNLLLIPGSTTCSGQCDSEHFSPPESVDTPPPDLDTPGRRLARSRIGDQVTVLGGVVFAVDDAFFLCASLMESYPPQCRQPQRLHLDDGFAASDLDLVQAGDVSCTDDPLELVVTVQRGGILRLGAASAEATGPAPANAATVITNESGDRAARLVLDSSGYELVEADLYELLNSSREELGLSRDEARVWLDYEPSVDELYVKTYVYTDTVGELLDRSYGEARYIVQELASR